MNGTRNGNLICLTIGIGTERFIGSLKFNTANYSPACQYDSREEMIPIAKKKNDTGLEKPWKSGDRTARATLLPEQTSPDGLSTWAADGHPTPFPSP